MIPSDPCAYKLNGVIIFELFCHSHHKLVIYFVRYINQSSPRVNNRQICRITYGVLNDCVTIDQALAFHAPEGLRIQFFACQWHVENTVSSVDDLRFIVTTKYYIRIVISMVLILECIAMERIRKGNKLLFNMTSSL